MMRGRTEASRQLLLPVLAGGLCVFLLLAALGTLWSAQARLSDSVTANQELQHFISSASGRLQGGTSSDELPADYVLNAGTPAEVSAQLSSLISGLAAANGLQILSTGDLGEAPGPETAEGRSSTSLQASGTLSAILATLAALGSARPLMIIEKLDIRSDGSAGSGPGGERLLSLSLRVASYARQGAAAP